MMQRVVASTRAGQHSRLLSLLQPWAAENASIRWFGTSDSKDSEGKPQPRVPGARVEFRSPAGATRPAESSRMAQELGVEVEEADTEVQDQKALTFRGKGAGPPGTKAPEKIKERDVFKASHDKQAAAIEQGVGVAGNPTESAQNKYAASNQSAQNPYNGNGYSVPAAKGERLGEAKYTEKAEDKISEARGKPAQPCANEEVSVNRYNAMKAAAAAAVNRVSDVLTDTQQTIQDKTKEALDQGAKVVKDSTGIDVSKKNKKQAPMNGAPFSPGNNDFDSRTRQGTREVHPGSKCATREQTEEAAHRGERDSASY